MNFSTNTMSDSYDEILDCDGDVTVAGMQFAPSDIIKSCDPIAYRIGVNEYIDSQIEDLQWELDRTDDAEEVEDLEARMEELRDMYI